VKERRCYIEKSVIYTYEKPFYNQILEIKRMAALVQVSFLQLPDAKQAIFSKSKHYFQEQVLAIVINRRQGWYMSYEIQQGRGSTRSWADFLICALTNTWGYKSSGYRDLEDILAVLRVSGLRGVEPHWGVTVINDGWPLKLHYSGFEPIQRGLSICSSFATGSYAAGG